MKKAFCVSVCVLLAAVSCRKEPAGQTVPTVKATHETLGYLSAADWGQHLVTIAGCNDCHSPKSMTEFGPVPEPGLLMSGHRAGATPPQLDRVAIQLNGYAACNPEMTAWVGPWGVSYAANLTPDASGIGLWTQEQFNRAMREGKFKGLENGRTLLPPMPWPSFQKMSDDELAAIFAYLKSLPPVRNVVAAPEPPASTGG